MIGQVDAIKNEQVDDVPLLLAVIKQMGLIEILNEPWSNTETGKG